MTCKDAVNSDSNSDEKESHLVSEDTRLNNTPLNKAGMYLKIKFK
jgi:hypothetical protein